MLTEEQVILSYEVTLSREPESDSVLQYQMQVESPRDLINAILQSDEYRCRRVPERAASGRITPDAREIALAATLLFDREPDDEDRARAQRANSHHSWLLGLMAQQTPPATMVSALSPTTPTHDLPVPPIDHYLAPRALSVSHDEPKRVVLVGGCVYDGWPQVLQGHNHALSLDRVLINHTATLPVVSKDYLASCDFQLIQIPLRSIMAEGDYMRLAYDDVAGHQALFHACLDKLTLFFERASVWSTAVTTFVMNYQRPQASMIGRFAPRYDLRNPVYFIEELNRELNAMIDARTNMSMLDIDHITGTFGRRYVQDDGVWLFSHGGTISDYDYSYDRDRLEPVGKLSEMNTYDVPGFIEAVWGEACAMWRTLRQVDQVKMVCVDLDDTVWRGVAAERNEFDGTTVEGWPLGFVEALSYLKKRGIILAVISKNDPDRVQHLWGMQIGSRFSLDDFAIRKIGWRPKAETLAEAIAEANVLPTSVVFVDDNPIERESVKAAIPGIRTLGSWHYDWRRILLWSSETQVAHISGESANRNAMIGAQVERETARAGLSRTEFLASLDLEIEMSVVRDVADPRFARAFELINKTNQFNTTGQRWSVADAGAYLALGGMWITAEARDRFVGYGLIAVLLVRDGVIDQYVMSCRVVGLEVEIAALSGLTRFCQPAADGVWTGQSADTELNRLSRDLYHRIGWVQSGGTWHGTSLPALPAHIKVV